MHHVVGGHALGGVGGLGVILPRHVRKDEPVDDKGGAFRLQAGDQGLPGGGQGNAHAWASVVWWLLSNTAARMPAVTRVRGLLTAHTVA